MSYELLINANGSEMLYLDTSSVNNIFNINNSYAGHEMTVIGWDDSKNAWILQNSWGDSFSYLYMNYNSFGEYYGIKQIAKKVWNNRYYGKNSSNDDYEALFEFEKIPTNVEKIYSIVGDFDESGEYSFYLSADGDDDSYELIKTIDIKMRGRHTINLENKNIYLNNGKFKFKVIYENDESLVNYFFNDLYVFTKDNNLSIDKKAYLYDIYDLTSKSQTLSIRFKGQNIIDKSEIQIKIKNENNEDITNSFKLSDSYYMDNYGEYNYTSNLNEFPDNRKEYTAEIIVNGTVMSSKKFGISDVDDIFKKGIGTRDDPFIITTAEQLQMLSSNSGLFKYYYKLGSDIDADNVTINPIGKFSEPFVGSFDGDNYTIYNLNITNSSNNQCNGLFGYINNATIKNVKLNNPNIIITQSSYSNDSIGMIAGYAKSSVIQNIYIKNGFINTNNNGSIGMIVGNNDEGKLSNLYSSGLIKIDNVDDARIGGIIGYISNNSSNSESYVLNSEFSGEIQYSFSSPNIYYSIGGIIGDNYDQNIIISNLLFSGSMNDSCQVNSEICSKIKLGYFVGRSYYNQIKNSIFHSINSNSIKIIGNSNASIDMFENVYAITDNDDNDGDRYINKNSEAFLDENSYNLDFNNNWFMSVEGPKIRSLTKDLINKNDSIGETNIYNVDYENLLISNVKTNNGTITRKEFVDGFITLSGNIYTSDNQLVQSDNERMKTGMILRKNDKDYVIVINGDISKDGKVSVVDIILLRRYLVGDVSLDDYQLKAADVNNDGRINTSDVIHLRRAIAGGYDSSCQVVWRNCE